eukprot:TRINITY_DN11550_c0_g1_i1.p1 TRINITY_DN11550_c0_g1~~TRINITY_DN11550_c0_g1_i1.p1  ORF type:complete len:865 (+),score=231.73 TRINITY_DN11550_c0_g1_i1:45-2597(+)
MAGASSQEEESQEDMPRPLSPVAPATPADPSEGRRVEAESPYRPVPRHTEAGAPEAEPAAAAAPESEPAAVAAPEAEVAAAAPEEAASSAPDGSAETADSVAQQPQAEPDDVPFGIGFEPPQALSGLYNIGNTCYLNSGVQLLANADGFVAATKEYIGEHWTSRPGHSPQKRNLLRHWRELVSDMNPDKGFRGNLKVGKLNPRRFVQATAHANRQFVGFGQQDSHEFVATLIAALDDELRDPWHLPKVLAGFGIQADDVKLSALMKPGRSLQRSEQPIMYCSDPVSPHSRRQMSLYTHLHDLFRHNMKLDHEHDLREAERKGRTPSFSSYYPRQHRSPVSSLFEGRMAVQTRCSRCQAETVRIETFFDLPVELPSYQKRAALAQSRRRQYESELASSTPLTPTTAASDTGSDVLRALRRPLVLVTTPFSWIARAVSAVFEYVVGAGFDDRPLTLDDCLAGHCDEEVLSGSNMRNCPHCDRCCEAVRHQRFVELPEYLCVTLKRFHHSNYGWTSKLSEHVSFPRDWEQQPALQDAADGAPETDLTSRWFPDAGEWPRTPVEPVEPLPPGVAPDILDVSQLCFSSETLPPPTCTTYTLTGIVVHHGSYSGGHYTSYVCKTLDGERKWVYCNDEALASQSATRDYVGNSQAYVLLYRKQPRRKRVERYQWLQDRARKYLDLLESVYVSPEECTPNTELLVGGFWGVEEMPVRVISVGESVIKVRAAYRDYEVLRSDWKKFYPRLDRSRREKSFMQDVVHFLRRCSGQDIVFISRDWLRQLVTMAEPGPVSNLCSYPFEDKACARSVRDFYCPVTISHWNLFIQLFGGGPCVTVARYTELEREQESARRKGTAA